MRHELQRKQAFLPAGFGSPVDRKYKQPETAEVPRI